MEGQIQKLQETWGIGTAEGPDGNTLVMVTMEFTNTAHISWFSPDEARNIGQQLIDSANASKIVIARSFNVKPS